MTPEGLPRARRLTRAEEIRAALATGARHRTARLDIFWRPNAVGHARLAVVVPRHGHTAVARNRLRRRVREHVRRSVLSQVPAVDVIIRPRTDAYACSADDLATDLNRWLARLLS